LKRKGPEVIKGAPPKVQVTGQLPAVVKRRVYL